MNRTKSYFSPRLARVFFGMLALELTFSATAADLDFDKTFIAGAEPAQIHYLAHYMLKGERHQAEAWRDKDRRFVRRTDDRIETHVAKPKDSDEWHMTVLDLGRHIRTDVDRTNLLRIGHFDDWFSLTHGLKRPSGPYTLQRLATAPVQQRPLRPCTWYALKQGNSESKICWSKQLHLPIMIADGSNALVWEVTGLDTLRGSDAKYAIHDDGFVRNDANQDINAD